ncbi:tRNA (cytidine(34)-2'-O)-methyltransferase [Prosthecomicrobium hirschii]|uniref:tRNA (cytidine(34)-2'-O)-methyltransferase n=1 Tax=Prosthecodimorpha hirschii TaxID=665126 RepID=UPI00221F9416|nr:tRNA (cytidine(34)-2'-O)-methyltransferase [Prosthecomicrobium hirschii]MCW1843294.1 tRNA (cytidine(34)-2'-O)-methyltransferase [Prosthecomicrobium hirschii]
MRLVLYQPDIPQNTGSILRLAACLGVPVDLIEPAGFVITDKGLRRAGLDYLPAATLTRHDSFAAFETWRRQAGGRLVLVTTRAAVPYTEFAYRPGDLLMLGRESAGVPDAVHDLAEARVVIPMVAGMRSVNVAVAAGMILGEALRQTGGFPAAGPAE